MLSLINLIIISEYKLVIDFSWKRKNNNYIIAMDINLNLEPQ